MQQTTRGMGNSHKGLNAHTLGSFNISSVTLTLTLLFSAPFSSLFSGFIVSIHLRTQCLAIKVLKEIIRDDFRLAVANAHLSSPGTSHLSHKKTEIISILKRRHNSMENVGIGLGSADQKLHNLSSMNGAGSSSINSATLSDGSLQKFDDDDDESDSDWDGFPVSDKKMLHTLTHSIVYAIQSLHSH